MVRMNRVDPWGDLHAVVPRGLFTGNRGCLVNAQGLLTRHHHGSLWISCVTEFRNKRQPLAAPHRWTPLFFLDEAVALAAGHRPCGFCRRAAYEEFRNALSSPGGALASATQLNRMLAAERLRPGRGLARAADRITSTSDISAVPAGAVIVRGIDAALVLPKHLMEFSFAGWTAPVPRPRAGSVQVLTPPTFCFALRNGYRPVLHPSAQLG